MDAIRILTALTSDDSHSKLRGPPSHSHFWPADYKLGFPLQTQGFPLHLQVPRFIRTTHRIQESTILKITFYYKECKAGPLKEGTRRVRSRRVPNNSPSVFSDCIALLAHHCVSPIRKLTCTLGSRVFIGVLLISIIDWIVVHMMWLNSIFISSSHDRRSDCYQMAQCSNSLILWLVFLAWPAQSWNSLGPTMRHLVKYKLRYEMRGPPWKQIHSSHLENS